MMPTMLYPNEGAIALATAIQTLLAGAEIHLFKSGTIVLGPSVTAAELNAEEADFTGYAAETIAAWLAPLLNPLGGASIESGTVQFAIAAPYTITNTVAGWYVTVAAGTLIVAGDFVAPIALVGAGDGIPMNVQLVFG